MNKKLLFVLVVVGIGAALYKTQIRSMHEQASSTAMATLVSSDGQQIQVPQVVAELSPMIASAIHFKQLAQPNEPISISFSDVAGENIAPVVHILNDLYARIQHQPPLPNPERITRDDDQLIFKNVLPIVRHHIKSDFSFYMGLFDYLEMPKLADVACWLYVDEIRKDNNLITEQKFAQLVSDLPNPDLALNYYRLQKNDVPSELSIADDIALNGMPEIKMTRYPKTLNSMNTMLLSNKGLTSLEGVDLLPEVERSQVQWLLLSNNLLTMIAPETFQLFPNLRAITLEQNKLTSINAEIFKGLTELRRISLSSNQLTVLTTESFKGLTNLEYLYLDNNQLTEIVAQTFHELPNLRRIWLNHNQLTAIAIEAFQELPRLEGISLDNNHLRGTLDQFKIRHNLKPSLFIEWEPQKP